MNTQIKEVFHRETNLHFLPPHHHVRHVGDPSFPTQLGDVHEPLQPPPQTLQLHEASKVQDVGDLPFVNLEREELG